MRYLVVFQYEDSSDLYSRDVFSASSVEDAITQALIRANEEDDLVFDRDQVILVVDADLNTYHHPEVPA